MTRKERLKYLNQLIIPNLFDNSQESCELRMNQETALRETIEELKQEPCGDCISREKALQIIRAWFDREATPSDLKNEIEQLPPVTPQPEMGRWIFVDKAKEHAHCSECDYGDVDLFNGRPHNYCEKCGTKMQEVQE